MKSNIISTTLLVGLGAWMLMVAPTAWGEDCARPVPVNAVVLASDTMESQMLTAAAKGGLVAGPVDGMATPESVTGCARNGGMVPVALGGLIGLIGLNSRRRRYYWER